MLSMNRIKEFNILSLSVQLSVGDAILEGTRTIYSSSGNVLKPKTLLVYMIVQLSTKAVALGKKKDAGIAEVLSFSDRRLYHIRREVVARESL